MPSPFRVIAAKRRAKLLERKRLAALVRYFYTGEWIIPSSPVTHLPRLAWVSSAAPSTLLAKH